jgi:NADPH-dependent 2,4-dienoyl-CoA reductase/sulfur reductase-like enzyme
LPGLGDELGFVVVDRGTLQATVAANVFALGDATDVPTSKAGSVAHFQGETLVSNIGRFLEGRELEPSFDGHTNCFIETGFHKALLIDFNYETEPLRGRFPEPHIGAAPAARGVPAEPSRQARVRVDLLACPPARPSHARDQLADAAGRQEARRHL